MRRSLLSILLVVLSSEMAVAGVTSVPEPISEEVAAYAKRLHPTLLEMVASDEGLMAQAGISRAELSRSRLAFERAFPLYRVDGSRMESAGDIGRAVVSTGIVCVPVCVGGKCPIVASFTLDEQDLKPAFVSVGQPVFTRQLAEAESRLRAEPELRGAERRIVEYPEAHTSFHWVRFPDGRGDVLIPHAARDGIRLARVVSDRAALEAMRTRVGKLYAFDGGRLAEVARYIRKTGHRELGLPVGSSDDDGESDKPPRTPREPEETDGKGKGAVLKLKGELWRKFVPDVEEGKEESGVVEKERTPTESAGMSWRVILAALGLGVVVAWLGRLIRKVAASR